VIGMNGNSILVLEVENKIWNAISEKCEVDYILYLTY
jgi:hypothetical protein